ncbi:LysM peptidoglycan-binding domain-containing protein [Aliivibrio fischeri]|uniref:LysM peptidoglycan-binding domain-containing protein n=2 Tax=Aliivibrio fischeri TaxID=668 RepID=A0A844P5E5_ALIFS|nr:LysM peptidoglycan-binding domain-containing protein [Aliivibrio fischeri]
MMNKKKIIMTTVLVSTLALSGCVSNDGIIEYQKQQAEQINTLDLKVKTLESQLQRQQKAENQISKAIIKLHTKQNNLSKQIEQTDKIYSIKQNDTLSSVAKDNGIGLDELLQLNPQIEKPNSLLIGQMINIK